MGTIGWRFPPLSGGTRQGYTNNDIEVFKGQELIDNLAREICQNSLDARDKVDEPVKVIFELKHVDKNDYELFKEFGDCLKGCRNYWRDEMDVKLSNFLDDAESMLQQSSIPILVASDFNTKGLDGSRSNKLNSPWEALTGSDGMSVKSEGDSGGSYGIGKNAPFACSAFSMVFYNTLATDKETAFIGVARVATLLNSSGKPTQRVGKYQINDDVAEEWKPIFYEDTCKFRDLFARERKGTDVIVVGFNQEDEWIKNVTKAVLKNFFVAISEGKLIVELIDTGVHKIIEADSISQLFSDYENDKEMIASSQLYKAFTSPDTRKTFDILEEKDVEVYIKADSTFKRSIANFRSTGMLVGIYSKRIFQHYAAVVVIRGKELGELLKDTEPPRHNRWDYKLIKSSDKEKRKKARNSILSIEDNVLNLLKSQFEDFGQDTIDAAGVGEYIPDEVDGLEGAAEGEDILKPKIKVGKIKTSPKKNGSKTIDGIKAEGVEKDGDIHNRGDNPLPPKPSPLPKPVNPDDLDEKIIEGIAPGKGSKILNTPNISAQRAFPISSSQGLYKIVIVPTDNYDKLYVACSALGEDGKQDTLNMDSFTYNGKPVEIKKGVAGPVSVIANTPAIFFVRFSNKEKMVLNVRLMEVSKK